MLKSTLKYLVKDSAFYGLGNGVSKSLQLITLPLIVKSVSDKDFSNWNMVQASTAIVAGIVLFGMDSAAARFYYDVKTFNERKKVFTNSLFVQVIFSVIVLPVCFIAIYPLEKFSGIANNYQPDFIIMLLWMPASALTSFFTGWFKWTFQKWNFFILTFGFALLNLLLLLYFKFTGTLTIHYVAKINLFCQWLMVVYCIVISRKYLIKAISLKLAKQLLQYGVPLMIVSVLGIVRVSLDRFFLKHYINDNDFAMYSFAQKLSTIIFLAVTAFDFAFNPLVFSMWDKPEAKAVFSKIQSLYVIGMVGMSLMIMSCSVPLIIAMGKESYVTAAYFLPFMLFANFVYGLINFAFIGINYSKKTYLLLILIVIALSLMAVFNLLLIKTFTIYAASASLLFANIILVILGYIFSAPHYHIKYNFKKDVLVFILGLLLSFPFGFVKLYSNIYLDAAVKLLISGGLFFILIRLFFYNEMKLVINRFLRKGSLAAGL
jgi:O-antigen/teichoic acid export membrane protein